MNLVIRAVSLAGAPLSQSITGYFDTRGGTIGRSDTNTMALPDPERHISRLQAEVWHANGNYMVRNVGTANAIMHNDHRIAPGESAVLASGDELQIGTYVLKVQEVRDNETVRTITRGRVVAEPQTVIASSTAEGHTDPRHGDFSPRPALAQVQAPAAPARQAAPPAPPDDPFLGLGGSGGVSSSNPFADLLGSPVPAVVKPAQGAAGPPQGSLTPPGGGQGEAQPWGRSLSRVPAPAAAFATPPAPAAASGMAARLPDDFDPFADPVAPPPSADPAAQLRQAASQGARPAADGGRASSNAFDLLGSVDASSPAPSLDAMFNLGGSSSGRDPLDDFLAAKPEGTGAGRLGNSLDPLELLTRKSPPPAPPRPAAGAAQDHASDLASAFVPPHVAPDPRLIAETIPAARLRQLPPDHGGAGRPSRPLAPDPVPQRAHPGTEAVAMPAPAPARPAESGWRPPADKPAAAPSPLSEFFSSPAAVPPRAPAAEVRPPAQPQPAAVAGQGATPEALWAAFQEGTGVGFVPPQGLNPDLMRVIGTLLRHSIEGTRRLVAARAATKQELRADVTIVQPRNNNPLKFAPDAQGALEQLLQPPLRGFLPGPEAVEDVMDDLLGHAIGTMAGMRAALDGVLARFAPDQLEAKLVGHSMLDTLVPMNRRAKLWELYLQHFDAVRTEAHDDFHSLFGKAFLQAYEQQLDRLDAERRKP
jgi:FHA domain-containing protein